MKPNHKTPPAFRTIVLNTEEPAVVAYSKALPPFTGIARSVQCFENNGNRNFRILTLHIEDDIVVKTAYSDPYAQWEAISRMDLWNANSLLSLNDSWQDKKALQK